MGITTKIIKFTSRTRRFISGSPGVAHFQFFFPSPSLTLINYLRSYVHNMGRVGGGNSRDSRTVQPYDRNDHDNGRSSGNSDGTRVYVGNLSWEVRWQDLKVGGLTPTSLLVG